jgi:tryptophan synthase beta chain
MTVQQPNSFRTGPDENGHFGIYGGRFVAETLMPLILELEQAYAKAKADPEFQKEMDGYLAHYVGRPSPLYFAERLTEYCRQTASGLSGGGAKVYFKRDELNHTGAHKINNVHGPDPAGRRMGKNPHHRRNRRRPARRRHRHRLRAVRPALHRLHGCHDVERQSPNVFRMKLLGAEGKAGRPPARSTLKDAMNEAMRDWVANVADTFYIIGTVAGPHPYPMMVRDFQSVIGEERKSKCMEAEGRLPDVADRLHRRRLQRDGPVPSISSTTPPSA